MRVYALSVHAEYNCRHSGACCTAGWHIPVERPLRQLLGGSVLIPDADGVCRYFDRRSRLCRVHAEHGEAQLPASCRHFPRRALIDNRGVFVTLSHFCPTAAALLVDSAAPLEILESPPGLPPMRGYDGLDARGEWPPLLRRDVLFDVDTYSHWERFIVSTFARHESVEDALIRIAAAAERLRQWNAGAGPFAEHAATVLANGDAAVSDSDRWHVLYAPFSTPAVFDTVRQFVPAGLAAPQRPADVQTTIDRYVVRGWELLALSVRRYLAAKAFGAWCAYQSRGIRTLVAELFLSETILRIECARACARADRALDRELLIEGLRSADLLLIHLIDREKFVRWLDRVEQSSGSPPS